MKNDLVVIDVGGGTIDTALLRIKDEYKGKVDLEALASDVEALGRKY
jgi:molecular chaperone DnaK (HSP70)